MSYILYTYDLALPVIAAGMGRNTTWRLKLLQFTNKTQRLNTDPGNTAETELLKLK